MGHDSTGPSPGDDRERGDARLVAGLRRRTPAAFAGLHEQYAAGIYNLALRVVRHAPDAEDITQDVLIRAYERLPREREVLLRPWLYRVTLNRCYDHLRAAARRRPARPAAGNPAYDGGEDGRHAAELEPASPHDPFEQSELTRLFDAALQDITRRQRAALLLKDVHGLTLVEVATCLEVTPGSVEVLLARARNAFRASFEVHCRAAGRPVPNSAKAIAALPMSPLPPALVSLPVPPAPAAFSPLSLAAPPIAAAAGSGIGAVLSLPAQVKTAALIIAAAATVGSAEVAANHVDVHRTQRSAPVAAVVAPVAPVSPSQGVAAGRTASPRPHPSAAARVAASPSTSPSAPALAETDRPLSLDVSDPESDTSTPPAVPSPGPSPSGHAAAAPAATPSTTPTAAPAASPSPLPSTSANPSLAP